MNTCLPVMTNRDVSTRLSPRYVAAANRCRWPALLSIWLLLLASWTGGCAGTNDPEPDWVPAQIDAAVSAGAMISAAHPLAVEAGLSVLGRGGNAIDAAVTVQMVLNVVEPPESGIGGGAFMVHCDAASGSMTVYDGRETAPLAAKPDRFMVGYWPLPLWAAVPTGLAVGVPGTLAMLHQAHLERGELPWKALFETAIRLAEEGIPMPERLRRQIDADPSLWLFGALRTHWVRPRREAEAVLRNPALANTLRQIARQGPDVFYRGALTDSMITAAAGRWPGRSDLTREDFDRYRPVVRDALCRPYRGWSVCGIPAPSSGGITVLQILGIVAHFDLAGFPAGDPHAIHLIAEASRLAFADRFAYIGDPEYADIPQAELLAPCYLARRTALIDVHRAMYEVHPGIPYPTGVAACRMGMMDMMDAASTAPLQYERETTGTSHFSLVDQDGNAVAMTTSIEAPFGSRIMTGGFLLNNQLTDFTFRPEQNGFRSPNAVEPGKRPRSSMAPIMVFDGEGVLRLVVGSRGGSRIIGYVVKTLIGVIDWDLCLQSAIAMPNFLHRGQYLELEEGTAWADRAGALRQMGHRVRVQPLESGIHGIERLVDETTVPGTDKGLWRGGADPRMDGAAWGPGGLAAPVGGSGGEYTVGRMMYR